MEILTRDRSFEHHETRGANPLLPWGSTVPPTNGSLGQGVAGVTISETTALQLAAVYGSVSLISDAIATLPIRQYKLVQPDEAKQVDPAPVIQQPWPEDTLRDFTTQGTVSLLVRGNLFGQIVSRDQRLFPETVKLWHPDHVRIRRNRAGEIEVRYANELIPPDDVTRAKALQIPEGIVGLNPIEYLRNTMGLARAHDLYGAAFFANSARPDGVIELEEDLDPEEAKAMKAQWLESFQGINHAHLPAVLTGGAKFIPIAVSASDAQFLEQMQFTQSLISGMIYRVPPHMIGMVDKDTSWGSGIEQQELGFVRNTLLIWLCRWEDLMTSWLPPRQFVMFDLSHRLRGDALQRWSAYQMARAIGAMNSAEIRKAEGLATVNDPALEAFDQPFNSMPVKPQPPGPGGDKAN